MSSILQELQILPSIPVHVADLPLKQWNKAVFDYELIRQKLVKKPSSANNSALQLLRQNLKAPSNPATTMAATTQQIQRGTYAGTQLALTEMFDKIERSFASWYNILGVESDIPRPLTLDQKKAIYKYQPVGKDKYPPHIDTIPSRDQHNLFEIFDKLGLLQAQSLLPSIVPEGFVSGLSHDINEKFREWIFGDPEQGITIAEIEQQNKVNRKSGTDIMRGANIGDFSDWYTDARFAQQYLTGTNPTTITNVSTSFLQEFRDAAKEQNLKDVVEILADGNKSNLYITDCSYFRNALGIKPSQHIKVQPKDKDDPVRYGCATLTLFRLHDDGNLHPLAIVIDYKGSMKDSVCLFNKRLTATDPTVGEYWPWRYAKTCAQSSDWPLHEMAVHLTNTHLIEEAIIVATHRCIPADNMIFQLLQPHWYRTLSLNAGARETLVPSIILPLTGFELDQGYAFLAYAYEKFNFQGKYVPTDLKDRGFPPDDLDSPRYRNYAYARNMVLIWKTIRAFVSSMLALQYTSDAQVAEDTYIKNWCKEIQTSGQIPTFPTILDQNSLADAITMCIHVASPQHSAVNYLQSFYQTFVINKPPCLFRPLPTTLTELKNVTEQFLVKSLPIGHQQYWLLAAHIPWLLSFRPAEDNTLINYAASLWNLYKKKGPEEHGPEITKIAEQFYSDLRGLVEVFEKHSNEMGEKERMISYTVLDPREAAISILI